MNFDSHRCDDTVVLRNPKIAKQQKKENKTHISDEALKQAIILDSGNTKYESDWFVNENHSSQYATGLNFR